MSDSPSLVQLRALWAQNPAAAILFARLDPQCIPPDTGQYAANLQRSIQSQRETEQSVNAALGAMGIFPAASPGVGYGATVNPDDLMFYGTMGLVRAHQGNPPTSDACAGCAAAILRGQRDPMDALALAGSSIPGYAQYIRTIGAFLGNVSPFLRQMAFIVAALAVPLQEIPGLLNLSAQDRPQSLEEMFNRALQSAEEAFGRNDFGRAEKDLMTALQAAKQTPSPDDDILAIKHLLLLAFKSTVSVDSLSLATSVAGNLVESNRCLAEAARIVLALSVIAKSYGVVRELDEPLTRIILKLLESELPGEIALPLHLAGAEAQLRQGNTAEAEDILDNVRGRFTDVDSQLQIACMDASIHRDNADREGASDILTCALQHAASIDPARRLAAVQQLVSLWPDGKEGLAAWLDELKSLASTLQDPARSLVLVTSAGALVRDGRNEEAAHLVASVDLPRLEEMTPDPMKDVIRSIREQLGALLHRGDPGRDKTI